MKAIILTALAAISLSSAFAVQAWTGDKIFETEVDRGWVITVAQNEQSQEEASKPEQVEEEPDCE